MNHAFLIALAGACDKAELPTRAILTADGVMLQSKGRARTHKTQLYWKDIILRDAARDAEFAAASHLNFADGQEADDWAAAAG